MSSFPWLTVAGAIPLAGAVAISLIPREPAPAGLTGAARPAAAGGDAADPGGSWVQGDAPAAGEPAPVGPAEARAVSPRDTLAKWLALGFSLATLVYVIVMSAQFSPSGPDFQLSQTYQWIPAF